MPPLGRMGSVNTDEPSVNTDEPSVSQRGRALFEQLRALRGGDPNEQDTPPETPPDHDAADDPSAQDDETVPEAEPDELYSQPDGESSSVADDDADGLGEPEVSELAAPIADPTPPAQSVPPEAVVTASVEDQTVS